MHFLQKRKDDNIYFISQKLNTFISSHEELLLGVESRTALYAGFDIAVAAKTPTGSPAGKILWALLPEFTPYSNWIMELLLTFLTVPS
jgi:hypothetical protein